MTTAREKQPTRDQTNESPSDFILGRKLSEVGRLPADLAKRYDEAVEQAHSAGALKQLKSLEAEVGRWYIKHAAAPPAPLPKDENFHNSACSYWPPYNLECDCGAVKANVAPTLEFVLDRRMADLQVWLAENAPDCDKEQKHLNEGSLERIYWHYGYFVATRDALNYLRKHRAASPSAEVANDVPCPENERSATTAEESGIRSAGISATPAREAALQFQHILSNDESHLPWWSFRFPDELAKVLESYALSREQSGFTQAIEQAAEASVDSRSEAAIRSLQPIPNRLATERNRARLDVLLLTRQKYNNDDVGSAHFKAWLDGLIAQLERAAQQQGERG
jgi:hypothetical protein